MPSACYIWGEMSTQSQIDANRQNAQRSTGPKTPTGKARSSRNAIRHGLSTTQLTVMPAENQADLDALAHNIRDEFKPEGDAQTYFVEQMIQSRWRLLRIQRLEAEALDDLLEASCGDENPDRLLLNHIGTPGNIFDKLERYRAAAERAHVKALHEFNKLRAAQQKTAAQQNKAKHAAEWVKTVMAGLEARRPVLPFQRQPLPPAAQNEPNLPFVRPGEITGRPTKSSAVASF